MIADMERLWVDNSMEKLKGTLPDDEVIEMMSTCTIKDVDRMEEDVKCQQCTAQKMSRTSVNFLKELRSKKWEKKVGRDEQDMDRKLSSKDALPEQI